MNKIAKFNYFVKRLGIKNTIKHYLGKNNNEYVYMYDHYYSRLKKDQYQNELYEWYDYAIGKNNDCITNPKTFNDKIQWMKLNCIDEIKTVCSDKYAVREYIKDSIGEEYLIPLLGEWDSFKDIDFDKLPKKYVLKSNTGSGRNIIVSDNASLNPIYIKKELEMWQRVPFGYNGMETQYLPIVRKIICEKLLDMNGPSVTDYKFHCFSGNPLIIECITDRINNSHLETWFNIDWEKLDIIRDDNISYNHTEIPTAPGNLDKMLKISEILAKDFLYVRVDLYQINGKIYFGELTFTPANGVHQWQGTKSQDLVGELLRLPYEDKLDDHEIEKIINELKA